MAKVGLTEQEIKELLNVELTDIHSTSEEKLRNLIVKTITANNEKAADDLKKLLVDSLNN